MHTDDFNPLAWTRLVAPVFAGLAVAVLMTAGPAEACSVSACDKDTLAASQAPANVSAIPITGGTPRLVRADDGGVIASSTVEVSHGRFLVPGAPLEPDTDYLVEFDPSCMWDAGTTAAFRTGATAAVPTGLGTVTLGAHVVGTLSTQTVCGSCVTDIQAAHQDLSVELSTELRAWEEVTRFMLFVDGAAVESTAVGTEPRAIINADTFGPTDAGVVEFKLFARCQRPSTSTENDGLELGMHSGEVRAYVADNTTPLVSLPFVFSLSCEGVCVEGPDGCNGRYLSCDAGTDAGMAETPDAGFVDAGAVDGGATPGSPEPTGCGCASAGAGALPLLAVLGLRRRSRRA